MANDTINQELELVAKAPASSAFPAYPASWYLFCEEKQLLRGPLSQVILGRRLVAFRTESGRVAVMDGHCSHLGADLGCGTVIGENLQCPFHNWEYGVNGKCNHIPSQSSIPAFARQRIYPTELRNGYLFFFNGEKALFPLPFFRGITADELSAARMFSFKAYAPWYMTAAQGFDTRHFEAVHERQLLAPPKVDSPDRFSRRNFYRAEVIGVSIYDRLLRLMAGRTVEVTIENWGGNFFCVDARFARVHSRFIAIGEPHGDETSLCKVIAYAPRSRNFLFRLLLDPLKLRARRLFTRGHLVGEAEHVQHTQYRPSHLIGSDHDMIECLQWLAALPQDSSDLRSTEDLRVGKVSGEREPILATQTGKMSGHASTYQLK